MQDTFKTLEGESYGEFRDRGSKFHAYASPVYSQDEWQTFLVSVKKQHPKARHFCYAYRIGMTGDQFRANDDGEPSGTAGRPILGQIDSFGLTNVFVVVVRYFGGTLLGTSGLINAYKKSTVEAFEAANIIEKVICGTFRIHFDYAIMSNIMNAQKKLNIEVAATNFNEKPSIDLRIRKSEVENTLLNFKARVAQVPVEMAAEMEKVEGMEIVELEN